MLSSISALLERYNGFLLDAYGVLLDKSQALPGAIELIETLTRNRTPWLVVTNSASRLPEALSAEFAAVGLAVPPERILTSGSLLADAERAGMIQGRRAVVLGPPESAIYAERAGARVVPLTDEVEADAIIIADQKDLRWPDQMDQTLSLMVRRLDECAFQQQFNRQGSTCRNAPTGLGSPGFGFLLTRMLPRSTITHRFLGCCF